MLNKLNFQDWLELYGDEIPEDMDLDVVYNEYVASYEEAEIDAALAYEDMINNYYH